MRPFAVVALTIVAAGTMGCGLPTRPDDTEGFSKQDSGTPVLSAVAISSLHPDTLFVTWTTDIPTEGVVTVYDSGLQPVGRSETRRLDTRHLAQVTPLAPHTAYTFSVTAQNRRGEAVTSEPQAFTTPDLRRSESELQVTFFEVLEIEWGPQQWIFAPRLEVTEVGGRSLASVTAIVFDVEGIGSKTYQTSKCVAPGETRVVLAESWGYEVQLPATRRALGDGSAVIRYVDRTGAKATVTVVGPVVRAMPVDVSGDGPLRWECAQP